MKDNKDTFAGRLLHVGETSDIPMSEKRNILLCNYVSLICASSNILLMLFRILLYEFDWRIIINLTIGFILFLLPLIINQFKWFIISRILLSWIPPLFLITYIVSSVKSGILIETSSYVGLRFFLVLTPCFSFLVFNLRDKFLIITSLFVPLFIILFYDLILNFFDVGYWQMGYKDISYSFNNARAIVATLVIGISFYLLKRVVEKNERLNEELLLELEIKNKKIQEKVKSEINRLSLLRMESEALFKASENRYHSLFEQASDAIMITNYKGDFIDINASLCKMFGYSKEELLKMNISFLIDENDLKERPIRFDMLANGQHVFSERRMVHKFGEIVLVEANVKKLEENAVMAIVRDVTEIRKIQRLVQINEAKFRGAFENSAIGMGLISLEGRWLQVNPKLCSIIGYSEPELLLLSLQDITYPDDLEENLSLIRKVINGEIETYQMEKRHIHKNGQLVWVNFNVSLVKDENLAPLYFVCQIEDITVRKEAQEKLILSQANLRATINNTEIMIWSVDRNFNLLMFNIPFFNYIKSCYDVEIKIGARVLEPLHYDEKVIKTKEWWEQNYIRALSGETVTIEEHTRFGMDLHYSLSPIIEGNKIIGVSAFAENITERKTRDRQLMEATKEVAESKLMALRSVMSPHFIFNALNSIQYFIVKNDRLNAVNHLSTFSKLIRSILTHSVKTKIKLSDEIELLKNYIQLEMTRFEGKFEYSINIYPGIETREIEIPSLLIQPYVENAILHGLYNKKDKGKLTINIEEEDEHITFQIEDDGVGRREATRLRNMNFPKHESMGIRLTEERLKLINESHSAQLKIEDMVNHNGEAIGTRVTLKIALTIT